MLNSWQVYSLINKKLQEVLEVDCKQPLFSSVNCGETQNKRGSLTVTVTELPLVVRASEVEPTPTLLAGHANLSRLQAYLFCVLPHGFSRKREIARSLYWKATIPGAGHLPSFFVAYMVAGTLSLLGYELSSKSRQRLKATIFSHNLTTPYNERHN